MKTIVSSRTYQLSHQPNETNRDDVTNYSRSLARGLDAEVLLDAVADVTGIPETFSTAVTDGARSGRLPPVRAPFNSAIPTRISRDSWNCTGARIAARFRNETTSRISARLCTCLPAQHMSIAWARRNSRLSRLLQSGAPDEKIFEEFYLAAFSRCPAADEVEELKAILAQRGDREAGLREFVWALISSREFAENH